MTAIPVTESIVDRLPERVRHTLRFRQVQVVDSRHVSPGMLRLTFGGDALQDFVSPGFDDHVKLIFPDARTGEVVLPAVGPDGPIWPDESRPLMRDYTPRHYDAVTGQLTIDFALHEAGPATAWAMAARPGDSLGVGGPKGSTLIPTNFDWHLLVGDETALPAIARRLETLPALTRAMVLVEVDTEHHIVDLPSAADVSIYWIYRSGAEAGATSNLLDTLAQLPFPAGDYFAWVACETLTARALRAALLERGAHPKRVKASGYWRRGAAASHEPIDG